MGGNAFPSRNAFWRKLTGGAVQRLSGHSCISGTIQMKNSIYNEVIFIQYLALNEFHTKGVS